MWPVLCLILACVIASFLIRKVQDMTSFEKLTASVNRLATAFTVLESSSKASNDALTAEVSALTAQVAQLKAEAGTSDADVDALTAKIDAVVPPPAADPAVEVVPDAPAA